MTSTVIKALNALEISPNQHTKRTYAFSCQRQQEKEEKLKRNFINFPFFTTHANLLNLHTTYIVHTSISELLLGLHHNVIHSVKQGHVMKATHYHKRSI